MVCFIVKILTTLSTLPYELLTHICMYCHPADLCRIAQCSKHMGESMSNDDIWLNVLQYQQHTVLQHNDRLHTSWLNDANIYVHNIHEYTDIKQYVMSRHTMNTRYKLLWYDLYHQLDINNQTALQHGLNTKQIHYYTRQIQLPLSILLSYTVYNGQDESKLFHHPGMIYGCRLLQLHEIADIKLHNEQYQSIAYIPITSDAGLSRYCIDTRGVVYQIHGRHMSEIKHVADNFFMFLKQLINPFIR